ncbi:MAG: beta-ketoacyl synthase N-terminal-like domain-containing protein, partial [Planctomycetota bacterium]
MIAPNRASQLPDDQRIVITGIGLTAPNGNDWASFRESLLECRSGVAPYEIRYFGETLAGICKFDPKRHQSKKDIRRGTRAGSVGVYAAN